MNAVKGWQCWRIEDCCEILDSKRIPINGEEREHRVGDVPYYGANGPQGFIDDFIFDEPLILIAEDGGRFDEFATRSIAYRISGKSWVNNHAHVLRARDGFSQDAIFYTLEHKDIQPFIVGGTRAKLNQGALRSIEIALPKNESEQSKIADVLSTVDRAIEQTEALIAKQQRIKTGLMQDLLTRGIDEQGNLRSEGTHEFKDSPLGRIPVEWNLRTLNDCVSPLSPICYGILMPGRGHDGGVPVIKVKDINGGHVLQDGLLLTDPKIDAQYKRSRLKSGDLLLTIRGTTGRVAIVPDNLNDANITQDTARVRLIDGVHNRFIYFLIQSFKMQDQIDLHTLGQAVKGINIGEVKKLFFGLPRPDEQIEITLRIDAVQSSIDELGRLLRKTLALKTSLMQDLLTGEKRVTPLLEAAEIA